MKGVTYLHENDIIHRDLKPSNIIIENISNNDKLLVKILDFGLAKVLSKQNNLDNS